MTNLTNSIDVVRVVCFIRKNVYCEIVPTVRDENTKKENPNARKHQVNRKVIKVKIVVICTRMR
jgi:hypothetical protein